MDLYYHTVSGHTSPFSPFGLDTTRPQGAASAAIFAGDVIGFRSDAVALNVSFGWVCR